MARSSTVPVARGRSVSFLPLLSTGLIASASAHERFSMSSHGGAHGDGRFGKHFAAVGIDDLTVDGAEIFRLCFGRRLAGRGPVKHTRPEFRVSDALPKEEPVRNQTPRERLLAPLSASLRRWR